MVRVIRGVANGVPGCHARPSAVERVDGAAEVAERLVAHVARARLEPGCPEDPGQLPVGPAGVGVDQGAGEVEGEPLLAGLHRALAAVEPRIDVTQGRHHRGPGDGKGLEEGDRGELAGVKGLDENLKKGAEDLLKGAEDLFKKRK